MELAKIADSHSAGGFKSGLFWTGACLLLLQPVLAWQLGPIFHSSELPWLLLVFAALLGQAFGYGVKSRLGLPLCIALAQCSPLAACWLRALGSATDSIWINLGLALLLASCGCFGVAQVLSFYWTSKPHDCCFRKFYRQELSGALFALGLAWFLPPSWTVALFPWLLTLAAVGAVSRPVVGALLLLALLNSWQLPWASRWAAQYCYPGGEIKFQQLSPYQWVEVVEYGGRPYLFLNGLCHYAPGPFHELNRYLVDFPAQRMPEAARRAGCLIVGSGSFVAASYARSVGMNTTVVELDPAVIKASPFFREPRQAVSGLEDWQLCQGDVRNELPDLPRFGLVVVNLPAPASLHVASLFTREFFLRVGEKLVPEGQMSLFLGAPLESQELKLVQAPIVKAVLESYPEVIAVSSKSCDNTVLLASKGRSLDADSWHSFLRQQGQNRFSVWSRAQLLEYSRNYNSSSFENLNFCAYLNLYLWAQP